MNKVITINLGGNAYQLEEGAYEVLRRYLEIATSQLASNPDRAEILADIEGAIGEKFRALLGAHKNVVTTPEAETIVREMGAVNDGAAAADSPTGADAVNSGFGSDTGKSDASSGKGTGPAPGAAKGAKRMRRFYRVDEGAMFFGVCSGLAAFTGMPALSWRCTLVCFTVILWGLPILAYLAVTAFVPLVDSPDGTAPTQDPIPTARDFIRRAREGYYKATKDFPDKESRKAWKRDFKRRFREWGFDMRGDVRTARVDRPSCRPWSCGSRCHGGGGCGCLIFILIAAFCISWCVAPEKTRAFVDKIPPRVEQGVSRARDWWNERVEKDKTQEIKDSKEPKAQSAP